MSYSISVQKLFRQADSKKLMERKEFLQNLLEIIDNNAARHEFTRNSEATAPGDREHVTWNALFQKCHQFILVETKRLSSKSARTISEQQGMCCTLISGIVRHASTTSVVHLNPSSLRIAVFEILDCDGHKYYHDTYMKIFVDFILSIKLYRVAMLPEHWQRFLRVCITLYESSRMKKDLILKTLQKIVHYSYSQSHLLQDLKTMFPFLRRIIDDVTKDPVQLSKPAYKFLYTVSEQIGTECRMSLCEFSENIIPQLINLEDNPEKYKLLHLYVLLHHPDGALSTDATAYACDWSVWKQIVMNMYKNIRRDIKNGVLSPSFIQLASEICKQIIEDSSYCSDELTSASAEKVPRVKRRRLSIYIQKPIDLFTINSSKDDTDCQSSIIEILASMINKYPHILSPNDLPSFLKIVSDLFSDSIMNEELIDSLCEICTVLIRTNKINPSSNPISIEETKTYWDKIWHALVKILGLGKNQAEGHHLLQVFTENLSVPNINALLGLYTTNEIPWSSHSIRSLYIICQKVATPDCISGSVTKEDDLIRIQLLKWITNISTFKTITSDTLTLLCRVVTNLTLRTWNKNNPESTITTVTVMRRNLLGNDNESKCIKDITRCNLSLELAIDLFTHDSPPSNLQNDKKMAKPLFSESILEFAIGRLRELVQFDAKKTDDIDRVIYNLTIVAKFISNLLDLNIENDDKRIEMLRQEFEAAFNKMNDLVIQGNMIDRKHNHIGNLIRGLATLYEVKYHSLIADLVVQLSNRHVLLGLFGVCNVENHSEPSELSDIGIKYYEDIFELRDYCREQQRDKRTFQYIEIADESVITIGTYRVLTSFGCVDAGKEISEIQTKALKNFLQVEVYAPTVDGNLWQSLVFMKSLAACRGGYFSQSLMIMITTFINELFESWKSDGTAVIGIISFVPCFLRQVIHIGGNTSEILQVVKQSYKLLHGMKYGPAVYVNMFKCLIEVIQLVPSLCGLSDDIPILEFITTGGIKNPFYTARLESVKLVHFIFASENVDIDMKRKLFFDIERSIYSIASQPNSTELLGKDEWNTRVSTALYTLGSIIHASGLFQRKSLISLFELLADKDIPINSVRRTLQMVIKNDRDRVRLIEINLTSLIMRWMKKDVSLKNFPWELTEVPSEEHFYKKYIGSLIHVRLEMNKLSDMTDICNTLGCSFAVIVEDNFPSIMCWLLAQITNPTNRSHQYAMDVFTRLKNNQDEFGVVQEFDTLLKAKLADILIHLIERLHDENHLLQMFGISVTLPRVHMPNLNNSTVDNSLQLLKNCLSSIENTLIHFIIRKNSSVIQKVLLKLSSSVYQFDMSEYKLKALHQYAYFSDLLMQDIPNPFFDKMAMFVVRDVCYTLIHFIQNENNFLSGIAVKYLFHFIKGTLSSRPEEFSCIMNFLVKNLITIRQSDKMQHDTIGKILKFLIVDSIGIIPEAIRKLDALPTHSSFDDLRCVHESLKNTSDNDSSLCNEIEHFLNTGSDANTMSCSFEGLSHLKQILSEKKVELNEMYRDLEKLRGFAEDCTSSILHRLIYRLVKLTEDTDVNISLEAAQCLGELGPADLTTMILHREKSFCAVNVSGQCELILTYRIAVQLADFIVGSDDNLRQASSDALYEICASCWGQQILTKKYLDNIEDSGKQLLLQFIQPFLRTGKSKNQSTNLDDRNCLLCFDCNNEVWRGDRVGCYTTWITNATCMVLTCFTNFYSTCLIPICKLNTEFCEMILPKLIYLMICSNDYLAKEVYGCIDQFFNEYFQLSIKLQNTMYANEQKKVDSFSHESVKCMLNVVNFIRIQSGHNLALKLNYLHIAKAAQYCSAYFTSVLYAELFCQIKLQQTYRADSISIIDHIYETHPNEGKSLQHILREAFVQIGEPDSIHGCGLSHLKDPTSRMQHYTHVQQWDKVMISQDVELSSGYPLTSDLAKALRHSGLDYLLNRFISTVPNADNVSEYIYETAWRLSDWNVMSNRQSSTIEQTDLFNTIQNDDYDFYHYQALKCLHANDNAAVKDSIDMARASIIKSLRNASLECSQTLYPKLLKLKMLRELEQLTTSKSDEWSNVISNWSQQDLTNINDFTYIEPILAQRTVMCNIKYSATNSPIMKNAFINTHLELSKCAEQQGHPHIAARSLALLGKQKNLPKDVILQLQYHDALLAWARNDHDIGRYLLHDLIKNRDLNDSFKARVLRIYGNWMAETKSENPQCVIDKYYAKSIELSNRSEDDGNNLNDTHAALAQFADAQYQQINAYMKTPIFESLKQCAEYRNNEKPVKIPKSLPKEEEHALKFHKAQDTIDVAEYKNTQSDQKMYLLLAVTSYLKTLQTGENHNFSVFRLVSLWLNNKDNIELNKLFMEHLDKIPSFKFIPLIPQLAPHITNATNANQFKIQIYNLVKRCAKKHPHHTLPMVFALMNNYTDYDYNKMPNRRPGATERELGAKKLINQLNTGELSPIINEMDMMANALIMLAYLPFNSQQQVNVIPANQKILKAKNFQHSLIPTMTLDVRPSGDYRNIVSVYKYDTYYEGVGGVNAPKKIVCIGTDGVERKQLVKGKDDLRQDAVMQQVFTIINSLLGTRKETKRRKLNIRTYKIVPLSQRSGVLEWCDNTLPISAVLCGTKDPIGMHKKYHPEDWTPNICKTKIQNAKQLSNMEKLKVYLECCDNLRPAFQYFFMEKFSSPEIWFERRLAYVRSVATTSMVGYIIGLGDRHFSNILIDQATAEVIHIDFGIAFEQGKVLPIPETVPFRLTRDIEAAMGISGVEGVMRKSCEETMSVLRNRREIIITLLQVLLYAPLFSWTITPAKAWELQSEHRASSIDDTFRGEDNINKIAERALLRIEQKLLGTEDGLVTSISGQVERLIQEARDPANLSKLFCGWQAYL